MTSGGELATGQEHRESLGCEIVALLLIPVQFTSTFSHAHFCGTVHDLRAAPTHARTLQADFLCVAFNCSPLHRERVTAGSSTGIAMWSRTCMSVCVWVCVRCQVLRCEAHTEMPPTFHLGNVKGMKKF